MIHFKVLEGVTNNRGELFPLIKPFEKGEGFSDNERIKIYGVSEEEWCKVEANEEADIFILPMSWNYYSKEELISSVLKKLQGYLSYKKPIWTFTSGDFGVAIPNLEGVTVFRSNGNRSQLSNWHKGMPVFIQDPLKRHFGIDKPSFRQYHAKPIIGFCGQANEGFFNSLKDILRTLFRNLTYYIGIRKELPQPLFSTTRLRALLLSYCEMGSGLKTNFVKRKKYRAGAQSKEDRERTTQEFYENIRDSDYTLCVRGGGNFSVRLYETLAMGRIPVFVDTDCLLPLQDSIDWKQHVVWVPFKKRKQIAEAIVKFHHALNDDTFRALQQKNRILWLEKLQMDGFFKEHGSIV